MSTRQRTSDAETNRLEFSENASDEYREIVKGRYPTARWVADHNFGRIAAGNVILSVRFSLTDPLAEEMGWWFAAQRLTE